MFSIPFPLLLSFLLVLAIILLVILVMRFSHRVLNRRANEAAEKISQDVRNILTQSPYCQKLENSEKKKYRGKSGIYGIVVYIVVFVIYAIASIHESNEFSVTESLLFTSPIALIILMLVIRDMIRISPGKTIYRIRAFCTSYVPGKQASYAFTYYNFMEGRYEGGAVTETIAMQRKNITPGHFYEILITPGKNRMRIIDVA